MQLRNIVDSDFLHINENGLKELERYSNSESTIEKIAELKKETRKEIKVELWSGDASINILPFGEVQTTDLGQTQNVVAVYSFKGVMTDSAWWWNTTTTDIIDTLEYLGTKDSVKAVIFEIDTNGGSPKKVNELNQLLAEYQKRYSKEMNVLVGSVCASAGMYAICGAKKIHASSETSELGSIGTMATVVDDSKMLENEGLKRTVLYAADSVNKNKAYEDVLKGDDKAMLAELKEHNDIFLNKVRAGRGDKLSKTTVKNSDGKDIEEVLSGKVYLGQKAVEMGLADEIISKSQLIQRVMKKVNIGSVIKDESDNNSLEDFFNQNKESIMSAEKSLIEKGLTSFLNTLRGDKVDAPVVEAVVETVAPDVTALTAELAEAKAVSQTAVEAIKQMGEQLTSYKATVDSDKLAMSAALSKANETISQLNTKVQELTVGTTLAPAEGVTPVVEAATTLKAEFQNQAEFTEEDYKNFNKK